MKYTVEISLAAENDIRKVFLWYESKKDGLGVEFEMEIEEAVYNIRDSPLKTQVRYNKIRVFFLKRFPYGIHFRVSEDIILIVGVFSTREDPNKWKLRI